MLHTKQVMIEYLKLKVLQEDWHGVADASMDLCEIEAKEEGIQEAIQRKY